MLLLSVDQKESFCVSLQYSNISTENMTEIFLLKKETDSSADILL